MKHFIILFLLLFVTAGCEGRGYEDVVAFGDSNTRGSNWDYRDYPKAQQWVNILKQLSAVTLIYSMRESADRRQRMPVSDFRQMCWIKTEVFVYYVRNQ